MKPNLTIGSIGTPIWFKRLRNALPLSMGILMAMSSINTAYAAQPFEGSEPTSINQTKGTVSGRITDNTVYASERGWLELYDSNDNRKEKVNNDKDFSWALEAGSYTIKVIAGGSSSIYVGKEYALTLHMTPYDWG